MGDGGAAAARGIRTELRRGPWQSALADVDEVDALMNLFRSYLKEAAETMFERGVAVRDYLAARGTPQQPGLVFALLPGGACRGVVYRLRPENGDAELERLIRSAAGVGSITYQGKAIEIGKPFQRLPISEALRREADRIEAREATIAKFQALLKKLRETK